MEKADGFLSGTRAALLGGTTLIIDLVTPDSEESLVSALGEWKGDAETNSCCDYAFRVAISSWNDSIKDEVGELVKKEGVNTIKILMAGSDQDKGGSILNNDEMLAAFEACKELGAVVEVHAENGQIIRENEKRLVARGISGPEGHLLARPEEVEEEAVTRACAFASQVNVPLLVSGPTSKGAMDIISKARDRGQAVFGNAFVASLAVDGTNYFNSCWTHAAGFVTCPPLRFDS